MMSFIRIQWVIALTVFIACSVVCAADVPIKNDGAAKGVLCGQFKKDPKTPLSNARLYIYNKALGAPSADRYVRVPDQLDSADNNGKFTIELSPGTYFISARVVPESGLFGPPAIGENVYYKLDSKGNMQSYVVKAGKRTNAGTIMTAVPRKAADETLEPESTSIEGIVTDAAGVPVEGALIYAYVEPDVLDRAHFVSGKTMNDGKFLVKVGGGGTYYLRVRGEYGGGTPRDGGIVNLKDPKELVPVTVEKGSKKTGVSIRSKRLEPKGMLYQGPR